MNIKQAFNVAPSGLMKATQITQDHKVQVIDVSVPKITGDEVLVKPSCCGICGTDLHILTHGFVGTNYPVVPGHEFSGHVVAVGPSVKNVKEGDFVSVDPNVVCGQCRWCRSNRPNLCVDLTPIGVGRPGAAAEYVAVPARNAFPVKESLGPGVAALIEPLACALHAVESSMGVHNKSVFILGGGTMGLLIAIASQYAGAAHVTLADPSDDKLETAKLAGVHKVGAPEEFEDEHYDIVFEAAGAPPALEQAMRSLEKTGVLVQVGVQDEHTKATFNPFKLYEGEFHFVGSNSCADSFPAAVELMTDIQDKAKLLLGESFSVWEFEEAIESMKVGKSVKTQLNFE